MKNTKLLLHSFIHSLAVFVYTGAIAWFLFNGEKFFGKAETFVIPMVLLLLFVLSAAIVGLLVLGRPVYMYFNGQKQAGIKLLFFTLAWLAVITLFTLLIQTIF